MKEYNKNIQRDEVSKWWNLERNDKKWGICQQNIIANNTPVIEVNSFVTANHPPTGGKAPGIAPIKVFHGDFCFIGV